MKHIISYSKALAALLGCIAMAGCQKEYSIIDELGLLQHTLNVSYKPGFTHITVYAEGEWNLSLDREAEWASLDRLSGEGLGDFRFSWAGNFGVARDINILINSGSKKDTIHVVQAGAITSPYMNLGVSRVVIPSGARTFSIPMTTNLGFCLDEFTARAVYDGSGQDAWISGYTVESDKVTFTVLANVTGADRSAEVIYYMTDAAGVETRAGVSVTQSASGPVFTLPVTSVDYYANDESYTVVAELNNIWSVPETEVSSDVAWISAVSIGEGGLSFSASANRSGSPRTGHVTVSCPGMASDAVLTVNQAAQRLMGFEELRSRASGPISTTDLLEGIIVSDRLSPNVCSGVQTGQFAFDRSENYRTAYLESTDGSYGICLKFSSAAENVFDYADRVLLTLDGTTLIKENSPARYTLSGLTADKLTVKEKNTAVPVKERSISQLSELDIYTRVSLQNVEILSKDGAYTNASEGYCQADTLNPLGSEAPRWDVAPLMLTDPSGDALFMLTNAAAPWRRSTDPEDDLAFFNLLPQGAGTLHGVVVADNVAPVRWGNLGKYQIRVMKEDDIALGGDSDRFSNIISEWTWNSDEKTLSPDEGRGTLRTFQAGRDFGQDYNNPYLPQEDAPSGGGTTNLKGLTENCALVLSNTWWNFDSGEGNYFEIEFITSGLNGTNLVVGIVWGHGTGTSNTIFAPSNWNVLYSTDGTSFTRLTTIKQRYCAWWTTTPQDAPPGLTEHLVKLPGSCFNQGKVVVRFQAADLVTDAVPATSSTTWPNALGIEKGIMTSSQKKESGAVRIGTITVRYN